VYEPTHEREYFAIRNAAALIDVSPLYKYELRGQDAVRAANRIVTRDAARMAIGQVIYTPWCDDDGKVIDDGTLARLGEGLYRFTAAEDNYAWFQDCCYGLRAEVVDVTGDLAALAVQGPNARRLLERVLSGVDLAGLRYYRLAAARLAASAGEARLVVSRTGYTGDLGYELWMAPEDAGEVWDRLMEAGQAFGILPAGILALDIARIEAGLVMLQVDYISARKALIESQKSSPYEIGMGWAVNLEKGDFVGRKALVKEKQAGSKWALVGLVIDWPSMETTFGRYDLVPQVAGRASRAAVPVYRDRRQIGQATSHTFSPVLKEYIALATVETPYARLNSRVQVEITVEYARHTAEARVVGLPFFNPERKRA
jgi:aminomethyltransferase